MEDQRLQPKASNGSLRRVLTEDEVDAVASWLRVIAEPMRIRLMQILNGGGGSVQTLAAQLGTSHQNVSIHLRVLRQAGIVKRRKIERRTHYELADWAGCWMVEQVALTVTEIGNGEEAQSRNCAIA